jgi:hypothetical protein
MTTRSTFTLQPVLRQGTWISQDRRYVRYARYSLKRLVEAVDEVKRKWPKPLGESVKREEANDELWHLAETREFYSDSAIIFAALAVEGFINFYGVLRLGEKVFRTEFERLGLIPKLRLLFLVCNSIELDSDDRLLLIARRVSQRRNDLVHPKSREAFDPLTATSLKWGRLLPEGAVEAVSDMDEFFAEFRAIVPDASFYLGEPGQGNYAEPE